MTGSLLLAGLAGWLALGCGQGEGDRCEINSDCNEGTCVPTNGYGICRLNPPTSNPSTQDAAMTTTPTVDAAATPDAGAPDAVKVDAGDTAPAAADAGSDAAGDGAVGHDHAG